MRQAPRWHCSILGVLLAFIDRGAFAQTVSCPSINALTGDETVRSGKCTAQGSTRLELSESCRAAARADKAPEVEQLIKLLQSDFQKDDDCFRIGMEILCALRPESALPFLSASRQRMGNLQYRAECLLALMDVQGAPALSEIERHLRDPSGELDGVLLRELLVRAKPESLAQLAPLAWQLRHWDPQRKDVFEFLCHPPTPKQAQAAAPVCRTFQEYSQGEQAVVQRRQHKKKQERLIAPLLTTGLALGLAAAHIGVSAYYRDSPDLGGGLFAYQGAVGGLMLGVTAAVSIAIGVASLKNQVYAVLVGAPLLGILGGVGGGLGGYYAGSDPGNGRVVVSVVSQLAIAVPLIGLSWASAK